MTRTVLPIDREKGTPGVAATCGKLMPLWGRTAKIPRRGNASTKSLRESSNLSRPVRLGIDDCPCHRDHAASIATPYAASLKRKGDVQNEEAPPRKKTRGSDAVAAHMILHPGSRKFQPWTSGHKRTDKEKEYNKAIEKLNIERDGQTTVTTEEKGKVAELEADPRVLWYTFVSVKCAGCEGVLCGDKRRPFYITLWEKHTKTCKPARAILRRQLELAPSMAMPASIPSFQECLAF